NHQCAPCGGLGADCCDNPAQRCLPGATCDGTKCVEACLAPPTVPQVTACEARRDTVSVHFKKVDGATSYQVEYHYDNVSPYMIEYTPDDLFDDPGVDVDGHPTTPTWLSPAQGEPSVLSSSGLNVTSMTYRVRAIGACGA